MKANDWANGRGGRTNGSGIIRRFAPISQQGKHSSARLGFVVVLSGVVLSGCQSYQAAPLPNAPDTERMRSDLLEKPLTLTDIATQAVLHSPDLVAARAKAGVADAQAFAAGLLPDPQFTASFDHPSTAGFVNGYALGLSEDLQALLTYPSRQAAANAAADQAKLNLLWDEWQTIEKAGTLGVQKSFAERKAKLLAASEDVLRSQAERTDRALSAGNVTLDAAGSDLAAELDTTSLHAAASREALASDLNLKQLLNFDPRVNLLVQDLPESPTIDEDTVTAGLAKVATVRPDLLALQAGYRIQEEELRQAILKQFPAVTFGFNKATGTDGAHTLGMSVSVNLPIFGSAQAAIRVQDATRKKLRAEYLARLDATTSDAWRIWKETQLLHSQIALLERRLPEFRRMAEAGARAHLSGDIAPATYVLLENSLQARESELLDLKASLWSDSLALDILLGMPFAPIPGLAGPNRENGAN